MKCKVYACLGLGFFESRASDKDSASGSWEVIPGKMNEGEKTVRQKMQIKDILLSCRYR